MHLRCETGWGSSCEVYGRNEATIKQSLASEEAADLGEVRSADRPECRPPNVGKLWQVCQIRHIRMSELYLAMHLSKPLENQRTRRWVSKMAVSKGNIKFAKKSKFGLLLCGLVAVRGAGCVAKSCESEEPLQAEAPSSRKGPRCKAKRKLNAPGTNILDWVYPDEKNRQKSNII